MEKYQAKVICSFSIVIEDEETNTLTTKEILEMSTIQDLLQYESNDSLQIINVRNLEKIS
jgi:hypothetical protein